MADPLDAQAPGRAWLASFADRIGAVPLSDSEIEALLALAGTAAHTTDRWAAPLACFLVGRAGGTIADAALAAADLEGGAA